MSTTLAISDPWREELTPRSRASRRRWTLVEAGLLLFIGLSAVVPALTGELDGDGNGRTVFLGVAMLVVFGVLRRGTRRLGSLRGSDGDLDERDLASRHRAFRTAFGLFLLVLLATLIVLPSTLPDVRHPDFADGGRSGSFGGYLDGDYVTTLGFWLFAWALFLPTAALAWREPDAPPLDEDDRAPILGEATRDVLLAAVLVLGGVIAVAAPEGNATLQSLVLPFVPFALFVAAVGAVRGRREGDGLARAAVRGWRVIALVAFFGLLSAGLGVSTGGGSSDGYGEPGAVYETTQNADDGGEEPCTVVNDADGDQMSRRRADRVIARRGLETTPACLTP